MTVRKHSANKKRKVIKKKIKKPVAKRKAIKKSDLNIKKRLLTAYSDLYDSIKSKKTESIKKEVLAALDNIENSKIVKKIEQQLGKFQKTMINESTKLAKNVKNLVKTSKKVKKPKKVRKQK